MLAFPNPTETLDLLGYRMRDKITGLEGVITSVCFDLYGCVQAALHPGLNKENQPAEQHWFDIARLEKLETYRVMQPPAIGSSPAASYDQGPAEKPKPRAC